MQLEVLRMQPGFFKEHTAVNMVNVAVDVHHHEGQLCQSADDILEFSSPIAVSISSARFSPVTK